MKARFTADYFIKKFSKIPKSLWTTGDFENWPDEDTGKQEVCMCALGHCGMSDDVLWDQAKIKAPEAHALEYLFSDYLGKHVADVNDNSADAPNAPHSFKGIHPRTRILNALRKIKRISK